jgi:hypothetical protein
MPTYRVTIPASLETYDVEGVATADDAYALAYEYAYVFGRMNDDYHTAEHVAAFEGKVTPVTDTP